ncbi:MAG: hypothetical protein KJO49_02385 [Bacteroidia bacterium]|nr:hypothetical protein [Bacteroidia bacterium]NNF81225.1 hypothetical protein [Flavobacteriaceae bacterium]
MKYKRLTKEQLEELHQEFINFLATQSITVDEWDSIKTDKPEVAEQELDVFSELVWEGVLQKVQYLENISKQHLYLFETTEAEIRMIGLKILNEAIDLTTAEGFNWLRENLMDDSVELFHANKAYSEDPLIDRFQLIEQGAVITKGDLFRYFDRLVG